MCRLRLAEPVLMSRRDKLRGGEGAVSVVGLHGGRQLEGTYQSVPPVLQSTGCHSAGRPRKFRLLCG